MAPERNDAGQAARLTQLQAAGPDYSVLLRAGAGSGKTHTLVDRFLRLCIQAPARMLAESEDPAAADVLYPGIAPRSILAITFTRKAAVEIKSRLLERARDLALAAAPDLRAKLEDLCGRPPSKGENQRATALYEQILEHPQGLKIGTIHHFCQLILGRFAVEAGLDPGYTVLEDTAELEDEALDEIERRLALDDGLAREARILGKNPGAIRKALGTIFPARMRLERWRVGLDAKGLDAKEETAEPAMQEDLRRRLFPQHPAGVVPGQADLLADLVRELEEFAGSGLDGVLEELGPEAARLTPTAREKVRKEAREAADVCAATLERLRSAAPGLAHDQAASEVPAAIRAASKPLLKADGAPRRFATGKNDPELKDRYQDLVMAAGREILDLLRAFDLRDLLLRNAALLKLGLPVLEVYEGLKQRDRVVDFQDLEELARNLMGDEARAISLLYRLDESITHIMVDEFQDTNFNQCEILDPLTREFLSGGSGQTAFPTVFYVGDVKQSIYGFRGAEPQIFGDLATEFGLLSGGDDSPEPGLTRVLTLPTNFRSLPAITTGTGELFSHPPLAEAIGGAGDEVRQRSYRQGDEGCLWILPPFAPDEDDDTSGDQLAAAAAAQLVRGLAGRAETRDKADPTRLRPLVWQDFLVLMRTRTQAGLYEDAFRRAGIPINPSGRGALATTREIQDLLALLRWLVWPEDDIALATVLRSPLFRLDQAGIQKVLARPGLLDERPDGSGYRTPRGLWESLRDADDDPVCGRAVRLLKNWRDRAGYEHCHDLVRRIYREGDVLERYRAALGEQAVYNLERIHDLTLGRELAAMPTVRGLIRLLERALRRGGQEVGLVPEAGDGGRVNFMTIHGAKGLEAPVVLYVDADKGPGREDVQVLLEADDACSPLLLVSTKQGRHRTDGRQDAVTLAVGAAADRRRTEDANLDYVAMTRARDRLYILGGDQSPQEKEHDSPLRRIRASADQAGCAHVQLGLPPELAAETSADQTTGDPGLARQKPVTWTPPTAREPMRIITPSSVVKGSDLPRETGTGSAGPGGIRHGLRVHALLEAAARLGAMPAGDGSARQEALAVFAAADLAWIFHPGASGEQRWSEVPVIAQLAAADGRGSAERITGVIDQLILRPGRVDIVDYKTNRCAATPGLRDALVEHYRAQLDLYRQALALVHPDRELGTWRLFTDPDLDPSDRLVEVGGSA